MHWFQARGYKEDVDSLDSQGSVSMSNVSSNYGGPFDNEGYEQSVAASRVSFTIFILYKQKVLTDGHYLRIE